MPQVTKLDVGDFGLKTGLDTARRGGGGSGLQKGLPDLPVEALHSQQSKRASLAPTASSVYSRPSLEVDVHIDSPPANMPRSSSIYPDDVSPPDSPMGIDQQRGHSRKSSFNVSPVSSDHGSPFASRSPTTKTSRYNSNLPVPKKNLKKFWKLPDKNAGSQASEPTTVRWDEYSGEPTDSDKGKPPSTTPGAVKLNEDPTPGRYNSQNFGTSTHISSGNTIPRKRVGNRDISDTSITMRPEWKGAGGRHKIVAPPADKPPTSGLSPKFPMGLHRKQQEEDEAKIVQERLDKERMEREQAEKWRLEEEERTQKEKQQEVERAEARQREMERAEQLRLDQEFAEQERRTRQRVVQARRERDLIVQAQKAKEKAALKAEKQSPTSERLSQDSEAKNEVQAPSASLFGAGTQYQAFQLSPEPDPNELRHARSVDSSYEAGSAKSETNSMSPPGSTIHHSNLTPDDTRSPLARNPSNEEIASPDHTDKTSRKNSPRMDDNHTASTNEWKPRPLNIVKDSRTGGESNPIESRFRADMQNLSISDEPKSRFSATTYATTSFNDSPPATPEVGSESPALSTTSTPNSILNRKRPIAPAGIPNSRATARKPTPSQTSAPPLDPIALNSKSLPKAPADAPKVPTVQTLQAKQDALRRRKRNIQTVIHELTEVVQPSSIAYDKASRQEIKKTVDQLKTELAEVIRDEHETGLKLHRAWKRQDDFAAYEPTSIWVRRVTT